MTTLLTHLDIDRPILAAPMAGGASTPALVTATARAGGLGFLAGGYKSAQALAGQIHTVESEGVPFGVNLFARNPIPVPPEGISGLRTPFAERGRPLRADAVRHRTAG
ncbi:Propionate 3-nitronate monooxygenase OS=Streptomyces rimosus subsp. rimosus (strain ATCC / DSM 40260 / JCM 4667 / NRRL 2234) OX=1265868 GN=SRIM_000650 PE=3 SV=1 [Streptomyces rimosus subsp. rimosus]